MKIILIVIIIIIIIIAIIIEWVLVNPYIELLCLRASLRRSAWG